MRPSTTERPTAMPFIVAILILSSAIFFAEDQRVLDRCELSHSRDTCHSAMYP